MLNKKQISFVFFGTPQISVDVLNILKSESLIPSLIVTAPDKKQGRGMKLTPPPVKIWAKENNVPVLQPEKLDSNFIQTLNSSDYTLFVVVAYGKILSKKVLDIPEKGSINLHYSLLPKLRGSSPVETAILENENPTGVTAILMNEKMDEGAILLQEEVCLENWPTNKKEMFEKLNKVGGKLLAEAIELWSEEKIKPKEQDHSQATYTKKIEKEDGLIDLSNDSEKNYRKFLAYQPWPGIYFMKDGKRIKITEAALENGKFEIKKVVPEGKKEIDYKNFR